MPTLEILYCVSPVLKLKGLDPVNYGKCRGSQLGETQFIMQPIACREANRNLYEDGTAPVQ